LAAEKGLGRNKARDFIKNGVAEQTIRIEEGPKHNEQRHTWIGSSPYGEIGDGLTPVFSRLTTAVPVLNILPITAKVC
jgi:hypothetical protein